MGNDGHPTAVFLRLLPPQDTPHDHIHGNQMALKMNPDLVKTDLDASYNPIRAKAQIVLTCIATFGRLDFLYLRLPFGTTPTPSEYTTISEVEIYPGNDLLTYAS